MPEPPPWPPVSWYGRCPAADGGAGFGFADGGGEADAEGPDAAADGDGDPGAEPEGPGDGGASDPRVEEDTGGADASGTASGGS
ncbi:hypothetical protein [Streptomyces sp. NBC_00091]|uniref:hypothetical protein n=1 Tax=Streptomyces sp. NBC_00091 TaxID=2975648 RepID=UPI002B1DEC9F|nr:hypothetical protein [Streptomyces sp. NBC_00091]